MKNLKRVFCVALAAAVIATASPVAPVFADEYDDDYGYEEDYDYEDEYDNEDDLDFDIEEWDEEEEEAPEQEILASSSKIVIPLADVKSKAKTIKDPMAVSVVNQYYDYVDAKLSYEVLSIDKKLTFKNNKLTVKKGTKAGTYKAKIRITSKAEGYDTKKVTKTVSVVVKDIKTAASYVWSGKTCDYDRLAMPKPVLYGKYKVTYSGPYCIVKDSANGSKVYKSGSTITFEDMYETDIRVVMDGNPEDPVAFKVTFTKN